MLESILHRLDVHSAFYAYINVNDNAQTCTMYMQINSISYLTYSIFQQGSGPKVVG